MYTQIGKAVINAVTLNEIEIIIKHNKIIVFLIFFLLFQIKKDNPTHASERKYFPIVSH